MQRFLATCIIGLVALGSSFNLDAASQPLTSPSSPSAGLAPQGSSVAILDLFNLSNDDQYDHWESLWGRGLRRVVFARKTLRLIEFPRIHAALQELKVDTYFISPDQVPPIAKKLGADFVVLGSFNVSQGVIAASLKVVDGKTGRLLKDETRFGSTEKPNDFTEDLNSTLLKILLGEQPAAEKAPASPATNEVISAAPAAPAVPAPTPVPLPCSGVPAPAPPLEPGEIPIQEGPIEDLSAPPSPSAFSTGQPAPSAPPAIPPTTEDQFWPAPAVILPGPHEWSQPDATLRPDVPSTCCGNASSPASDAHATRSGRAGKCIPQVYKLDHSSFPSGRASPATSFCGSSLQPANAATSDAAPASDAHAACSHSPTARECGDTLFRACVRPGSEPVAFQDLEESFGIGRA
ncbi:MAG: hypothetical protein IPI28_14620 [Candidatus Omnitrophica bacterium]|nr:hypothetical protein [Candidatus Omnitrophota bacterium]